MVSENEGLAFCKVLFMGVQLKENATVELIKAGTMAASARANLEVVPPSYDDSRKFNRQKVNMCVKAANKCDLLLT